MSETYVLLEVYRGWEIYALSWLGQPLQPLNCYALKGDVKSPTFTSGNVLEEVKLWIDIQASDGTYDPTDNSFSPDLHQWVGSLTKADVERENKLVALGPAPPGFAGKAEGMIFLLLIARFSKTPQGMRILRDWGTVYLNNIGKIITGLATSSSSNVYNCLINAYKEVRIYQRMGLMSAHDAVQTCAWVDHVMGEMLKAGYFKESLGGLTTLVNATSETGAGGEKAVGLASLAKLLAGGA
jgi:hypothetical protein